MRPYKNISVVNTCCAAILLAGGIGVQYAHAEKADRQKKIFASAESQEGDLNKGTYVLKGNVEVTKGSLLAKANCAIVTELSNKKYYFQFFSALGKPVTFRQKRDGGENLWLEAEAKRIEYNDISQEVRLISNAKIRYLDGKKITEELEGEFFSYDSLNEMFFSTNNESGKTVPNANRVKVTFNGLEN